MTERTKMSSKNFFFRNVLVPFVRTGDFTLRSGQKSDLYIDVKNAMLSKGGSTLYVRLATDIMNCDSRINCVVGYGYGGAIFCTSMMKYGFDPIIFRSQDKTYGLGSIPIGQCSEPPGKFAILEDVITTEGSVRECLDAMVNSGLIDAGEEENIPIFVIVDRRKKEFQKLKKVYSLFTEEEIREYL
jgi:orotate phosphoribosyltransferase